MNILVLDPKGQFYLDTELLPNGKLEIEIKGKGMKFKKLRILEDLYLPPDAFELFGALLQKSGFIKKAFNILSDRELNAAEAIAVYLQNLHTNSKGKYGNLEKLGDDSESLALMNMTLKKFTEIEKADGARGKDKYNHYIDMIYSQDARKDQLIDKITTVLANTSLAEEIYQRYWRPIANLFSEQKVGGQGQKESIESIIDLVTNENNKGQFIILDLSERGGNAINENLQAMFVKIIEAKIKERGERFYEKGKKVNCLVVMDEAHRFIARDSSDPQIIELTSEIIDSVRTTRKYGIGYMFITQTIESLDREILEQMRIFAFGYGLTSGSELKKISDRVNVDSAISLYRSFIDPARLSFTGAPLFLEVYNDVSKFK
jgi:hypothetical protein